MAHATAYVFGYGSLAQTDVAGRVPRRDGDPRGYVCDLLAHQRTWGVAMDNRVRIPGYKVYLDRAGDEPDVFVLFLDAQPSAASGARVNGVCVPVTARGLRSLDRRERNYDRVDVTDLVSHAAGRVWAYLGSTDGRARARTGVRGGSAVVDRAYLGAVERSFARLGPKEIERYRASTAPPGGPPADLRRVELPSRWWPGRLRPVLPPR